MNIYISNLSYDVNDSDLRELFEEYGEVSSAKVIMDRETGRSRGFGFVEMSDDTQGQKAIDELNQAEYDGKVINVNVAKPIVRPVVVAVLTVTGAVVIVAVTVVAVVSRKDSKISWIIRKGGFLTTFFYSVTRSVKRVAVNA